MQIYWVGPILGSLLATFFYFVILDKPDRREGDIEAKECLEGRVL
jgi:hypothetical protein